VVLLTWLSIPVYNYKLSEYNQSAAFGMIRLPRPGQGAQRPEVNICKE